MTRDEDNPVLTVPSPTNAASYTAVQRSEVWRVLTVLPDFPLPASTGLHLRMISNLELVRRLGCLSSVLYFSTEGREAPKSGAGELEPLCDEAAHAGRRKSQDAVSTLGLTRRKLDFLLRGAMGIPGSVYPFSMSYDMGGASELILAEAKRVGADFIVLPSMFMHYTRSLRSHGFKVILDAADVLTDLSASFLKGSRTGRGGRLGLVANYLACRSQERTFLKECTEVWATSAAEAATFRRIAPGVRAIVVPNSLDERSVTTALECDEPVIGFIGTYTYTPNLDAALFLAEQAFPLVLKNAPKAILRLAGAGMPNDVASRLRLRSNVEVAGTVPDSGTFMDDCAVLALPVRLRGGVPLKLVEAMARGKAIVASPEIVRGLGLEDGVDVLVRDNPSDFAAAVVALLDDRTQRELLGAAARKAFLREFSLSSAESTLRRESVLARNRDAVPVETSR